MNCDHEWEEGEEPDEWPTPESGWYLRCVHCGKWALQPAEWEEDYEIPMGDTIVLTPKGWIEEDGEEYDVDTL